MIDKREKLAFGLTSLGILWYIVENWYFGWHLTPQSQLEAFLGDSPVWILIVLGFFIRPTRVEKHEHIVNTEKVEMINNKPDVHLNCKEHNV